MIETENIALKNSVKDYWNDNTCGTYVTDKEKYTKDYFEEIENERYSIHPEVFNFAQFTRFKGNKVLEIGIGAGSDFIQWVRAGAKAYGIDLTEEAVEHAKHRLNLYGLEAEEIKVDDAENLSFESNFFDLVYSWGVIHHSPNTIKALEEIIRVLKPGGKAKIMIYNRHSLLTYFFWVKHALLKLRPWKSLSWVLWHHMESIGTKAYTITEFEEILEKYPNLENRKVGSYFCYYDKLMGHSKFLQLGAKIVTKFINPEKRGWFLTIEFSKKS